MVAVTDLSNFVKIVEKLKMAILNILHVMNFTLDALFRVEVVYLVLKTLCSSTCMTIVLSFRCIWMKAYKVMSITYSTLSLYSR